MGTGWHHPAVMTPAENNWGGGGHPLVLSNSHGGIFPMEGDSCPPPAPLLQMSLRPCQHGFY